jgi:hypothetical protein
LLPTAALANAIAMVHIPTHCPPIPTHCPPIPTHCPPIPTYCPPVALFPFACFYWMPLSQPRDPHPLGTGMAATGRPHHTSFHATHEPRNYRRVPRPGCAAVLIIHSLIRLLFLLLPQPSTPAPLMQVTSLLQLRTAAACAVVIDFVFSAAAPRPQVLSSAIQECAPVAAAALSANTLPLPLAALLLG